MSKVTVQHRIDSACGKPFFGNGATLAKAKKAALKKFKKHARSCPKCKCS